MEQLLDAFGIDWKLLLAQAVNFGVLLAVLTYLLYKPLLKTLDERAEKVAKGVRDAEEAATALATADEEAKGRVKAADTEAQGIVASARQSATAEKARIVQDAESRAKSIADDAEARAKETAAKALRESEQEVARLAVLAAEKVLRQKA